MATTADVQKLASLARIRLEEGSLEKFTGEFDAILAYVGQLEELDLSAHQTGEKPALFNIMRTDTGAHEARAYTEKLAEQFPARSGDALVVKQIISHE